MYTARMHLGLNQRLGLSRNKVAVPEGVAGTPPFWIPIKIGKFQTPNAGSCHYIYSLAFRLTAFSL